MHKFDEMARNKMKVINLSPCCVEEDKTTVVTANLELRKNDALIKGESNNLKIHKNELDSLLNKEIEVVVIFVSKDIKLSKENSTGIIWVPKQYPRIIAKIIDIEDSIFIQNDKENHILHLLLDCGITISSSMKYQESISKGDIVEGTGWFLLGEFNWEP